MTEVDHKDQDTTSASEETSQETAPAASETQSTETASQDIDYKAELERAKAELDKAQHTIVSLKKQKKQETVDADLEDTPDIRSVVREELRSITLEQKVDGRASSPEEAALIKFHLNNSIVRTGNDEEDIKRARALANANKVETTINALTRIAQKPQAASTPSSGGQKAPATPPIELTPQEKAIAQRYGLSPEEIVKSRS